MYEPPIVFTAEYSDGLAVQAARAFRDYQFKRYGPLFIAACVVNALGLWLALHFGAEAGLALGIVAFVVVLGPTWLLYKYFVAPPMYAARLRRVLPSQSRVSLAAASVSLEVQGQQVEIPWSRIKAVVETSALFLLVVSPFAFTFVPRIGMPAEAHEALHARSRYRAA
jgi:hypothetical protein